MIATRRIVWAAAMLLMLALPVAIALLGLSGRPDPAKRYALKGPTTPPPKVEPMRLMAIDAPSARAINAAIPFIDTPIPAARAFLFSGGGADRDRATDCLAAAMLYEAGDDAKGERAVGQVVLNRLRHPAFPKSVCAVVFQGSERVTGCQFTFTCDGAMRRVPGAAAWDRARKLAREALGGAVYRAVGYATHYHTDWVVPYWSSSLDKIAAIDTHLFFRWPGWWGTPAAFRGGGSGAEPVIPALSSLSPAHAVGLPQLAGEALTAPGTLAAESAIDPAKLTPGARFGAGRLAAMAPGRNGFIVTLDPGSSSGEYEGLARQLCAGQARCRIMGWTRGDLTPTGFPISPAVLDSMSWSYIHDSASGLQRSLWNCREFPQSDAARCMRDRTPVAAKGAEEVPVLSGVRPGIRGP